MSRKHLLSFSSFAPPFPPFVRAMVPKMVARKQCSLGGKQRLNLWFACSTFISLPVLSCCGCYALSSLHISIHVSFFLLSLVACILQSFQTVSFMLLRHNSRPQGCSWCALHHWYVRCRPCLEFPRLLHSLPEVITRKVFSTEFRCCTLLRGTFFAPLWNLDLYVGGHRQH